MSVKDKDEVLIIQNATTGDIIDMIDVQTYSIVTISCMINDLLDNVVYKDYQGLLIKKGYRS